METSHLPPARTARTAESSELLARLRAGDSAAFEQAVRDHGPRLLAVARRYTGNDADAQDAVQDAFVSAFRALPAFDGTAGLGTWLHTITVRAALMKLRTRRRRGEVAGEAAIEELLPRFADDGHRLNPGRAWAEPIDRIVQRQEACALVRRCIHQLPEIYRSVLLLRDIEECDTEETARLLDVSTSVVKTRLHRARQALRTLLDPYFAEPADPSPARGGVAP